MTDLQGQHDVEGIKISDGEGGVDWMCPLLAESGPSGLINSSALITLCRNRWSTSPESALSASPRARTGADGNVARPHYPCLGS
jgi:hypothetical protein